MGRKQVDEAYKKIKVSVSVDRWVLEYYRNNKRNLSEIVNRLLKQEIINENKSI